VSARTRSHRRPALSGALALALCAPLGAAGIPVHPRQLHFPAFEFRPPAAASHRIELPGGHVAFLVSDPALPLVDVAVALEIGSYLDPPERAGLALLTGALLRRGGAGNRSPDELDERIDYLGAELDSHFGELRGGLSLSVPSWELGAGLELLFDAIYRPLFAADRLADVRANLLEGLGRRNVEPLDILEREWQWQLYGPQSFLTRPLTARSVEAITRADVVDFHRRHVVPGHLLFAVSGDVTREELVAQLSPFLTAHPARPAADGWPPPSPTFRPVPGLYVVDVDTPQAKVLMGHRALRPADPEQRAAARVMGEILGGSGAISRIAGRLRTAEGLVYRASASLDDDEPWPRDFRVFFETATANTARATSIAIEEIERLRRELVSARELAVVQQSMTSAMRLAFDTAEKTAGWLAEDELLGRDVGWRSTQYRLIQEVGREEVRQAARELLHPDRLVVLVAGRASELLSPAGDGLSAIEKALGSSAVRLPLRDPLTLEPRLPGPSAGGLSRRRGDAPSAWSRGAWSWMPPAGSARPPGRG
jgi:predicted Zn-dependent peptidase